MERRRAWGKRHRRVRLAMLLVAIGGAGAALFWLGTEALARLAGAEPVRDFVRETIADIPLFGNAARELSPTQFEAWTTRYDNLTRVVLGWILAVAGGAFIRGNALARRLTTAFYRPHNDWAFLPLARPQTEIGADAAQCVMPWQEPRGSRQAAWAALIEALTDGTGDGGRPWWAPFGRPSVPRPFSYALLLGRPGAGKSRLALETGRWLGRRKILGSDNSQRWAAASQLRQGEWLRRRLWFLKRRPDDPWDAGQLDQAEVEAQLRAIEEWRPRRPTLLWLDDPAPSLSAQFVERLRERSTINAWRFPVRLLISNQTVPTDLVERPQPAYRPTTTVTLRATAFDIADVRALSTAMLGDRWALLYQHENVAAFLTVTEGNPLLVELGFDWLRQGHGIADLNRQALLEARLSRIRGALKVAGFPVEDAEAMRALACLTLVGPGCPLSTVNAAFGNRLPPRAVLARAFPVEASRDVDLARNRSEHPPRAYR